MPLGVLSSRGPQRIGLGNCLLKTQVCAKPKGNVYRPTLAQCWKVKGWSEVFGPKLLTEAPVKGGRNYDGPKVAKFLVG